MKFHSKNFVFLSFTTSKHDIFKISKYSSTDWTLYKEAKEPRAEKQKGLRRVFV